MTWDGMTRNDTQSIQCEWGPSPQLHYTGLLSERCGFHIILGF